MGNVSFLCANVLHAQPEFITPLPKCLLSDFQKTVGMGQREIHCTAVPEYSRVFEYYVEAPWWPLLKQNQTLFFASAADHVDLKC